MMGAFSDVALSKLTYCVRPDRNDLMNPCV